jgi:hypothetical protein
MEIKTCGGSAELPLLHPCAMAGFPGEAATMNATDVTDKFPTSG